MIYSYVNFRTLSTPKIFNFPKKQKQKQKGGGQWIVYHTRLGYKDKIPLLHNDNEDDIYDNDDIYWVPTRCEPLCKHYL